MPLQKPLGTITVISGQIRVIIAAKRLVDLRKRKRNGLISKKYSGLMFLNALLASLGRSRNVAASVRILSSAVNRLPSTKI
jgi:hypothetical protein